LEGDEREVTSMITRMIDLFKSRSITTFFTSLVSANFQSNTSGEIGVSSLIDTWIVVRMVEEDEGRKRTRELFIVKSRGTNHDGDVHKFILSDDGIMLMPNDGKAKLSTKKKKDVDKNVAENKANQ
jgi:circadian clock protein KaiC